MEKRQKKQNPSKIEYGSNKQSKIFHTLYRIEKQYNPCNQSYIFIQCLSIKTISLFSKVSSIYYGKRFKTKNEFEKQL